MRHLKSLVILSVLCGAVPAGAADLKLIANPSVKASGVSLDEVKGIFLATKTELVDGSHVEPVLLKAGSVHSAFVKDYLGKTEAALETYYRSLVFTGKGLMPKSFSSEAEVAAYVAKTKGAIGYVSAGAGGPGVKILEVR